MRRGAERWCEMKKIVGLIMLVVLAIVAFVMNKEAILSTQWTLVDVVVYGIFALTVLAAIVLIPYILGSKAIFIYGYKEGFVSLLYSGVENGGFNRTIGVMKGYTIYNDGRITENAPGKSDTKKSFAWIGLWPTHGAMKFDTEQVKLINKEDGSIDTKLEKYPQTIYIPIRSTEKLVVLGLELEDLGAKIDWEVVITYEMTNAYTAKIRNRGSIKILKAQVIQGLKETAGELTYEGALKLKNATGTAYLKGLVESLNRDGDGFGSMSNVTGYRLISIEIVGIELSGTMAGDMAKAYASTKITTINAKNTRETAEAERFRLEEVGAGTAKAESLMVDQVIRRLIAQKELTDGQALALAIEKAKPQVIGANPLISLDPKWGKKTDPNDNTITT